LESKPLGFPGARFWLRPCKLQLLLASLNEEKAADENLTKIAKSCVNIEAVA
jgi:hypothetical protein